MHSNAGMRQTGCSAAVAGLISKADADLARPVDVRWPVALSEQQSGYATCCNRRLYTVLLPNSAP
jgi:hypothetical protein